VSLRVDPECFRTKGAVDQDSPVTVTHLTPLSFREASQDASNVFNGAAAPLLKRGHAFDPNLDLNRPGIAGGPNS